MICESSEGGLRGVFRRERIQGLRTSPRVHLMPSWYDFSRRRRTRNRSFQRGRRSAPRRWERVSTERLGNVLPDIDEDRPESVASVAPASAGESAFAVTSGERIEGEAAEFVRFCYRRRSVAWPELYDEMCAVAARGDFRGMTYEHLEHLGIGFALSALPALAALVARIVAEERRSPAAVAAG